MLQECVPSRDPPNEIIKFYGHLYWVQALLDIKQLEVKASLTFVKVHLQADIV